MKLANFIVLGISTVISNQFEMTVCTPFEEAKLDTSVSIKAKLAEREIIFSKCFLNFQRYRKSLSFFSIRAFISFNRNYFRWLLSSDMGRNSPPQWQWMLHLWPWNGSLQVSMDLRSSISHLKPFMAISIKPFMAIMARSLSSQAIHGYINQAIHGYLGKIYPDW